MQHYLTYPNSRFYEQRFGPLRAAATEDAFNLAKRRPLAFCNKERRPALSANSESRTPKTTVKKLGVIIDFGEGACSRGCRPGARSSSDATKSGASLLQRWSRFILPAS